MGGVGWARSSSRSSFVDSLPAPRASERCALGFTLIIDDINAVMISAAESVPLRMTFPAWCPTNTGILIGEDISGGVRPRRPNEHEAPRFSASGRRSLAVARAAIRSHASIDRARALSERHWP